MKVRLRKLRAFIAEEVWRAVERSAGTIGGGGTGSSNHRLPGPPGLGDGEKDIDDDYEEQEPGQIAARVAKRAGGSADV